MPRTKNIVLALSEMNDTTPWVELAARIMPDADIHLRGLVTMSEDKSLSEGATQAREWRDHLSPLAHQDARVEDRVQVYVDYKPMLRVLDELSGLSAILLLVQWTGPGQKTGGIATDLILQQAPCDVALICGESWNESGTVLLSLRGGPNLSLGVQVAAALAVDEPITLFHVADSRQTPPDLKALSHFVPQIKRAVTAVSNISEGIVREAEGSKAIVMGATLFRLQAGSSATSSIVQEIHERSGKTLVLVRARHPEAVGFHPPRARLPFTSLSDRVDRWFAENSFHSGEFADLNALMALKEKRGATISVGLPALNEEGTVGHVIQTLKEALMDAVPLVDEIVLIDSMSTDNTIAVAEGCGIPAFKHPEILPELESYHGKGEALWKSLHVLKGDIIVWIDTDITNIHPRFIYGLLGPLLARPQIQYVKGYYQRPIKVGEKMQAYGGGRVTELVARPLLNLFYPELSGIIQPLSGEYAGWRSALEQVPFFSGYGVETGLIIDLHERFGLDSIAQTDLEMRVHHNQPLVGLSKMSFAILQVFIARLEHRYGIQLLDVANRSMKLIVQEPDRFALDIAEIGDIERPPMIEIAAYMERRESLAAVKVED